MPTSRTEPSTPRLSEVARHVVIPAGIVTTAWPRVSAKCAELGVRFDEWQNGAGSIALGKREDGKYAATVGGIVLSIPRQVGKTFLVGMIVIALCLLFPGMTVLWTAHRTRTATKTFHALKAMTERPKIKPLMLDPRLSNGEQELRFRNGSVIMFGAREQGFGRGFEEVDIEVFDEAQILSEKALEDMVPATNQSRQPAGALLFFMGTPPRPADPGAEFTNRRDAALSGQSEDMVYIEFSADQDADPDDRAQWAKANPSFPRRTPVESMKRMRANLTDDASFMREGLGVWDPPGSGALSETAWLACADTGSLAVGPVAFAIDVAPDGNRASIAVAGVREDGLPHVAIVDSRAGIDWVPARVAQLLADHHNVGVALDPGGPAGALLLDLDHAGVKPTQLKTRDVVQACGRFLNLVEAAGLRHRDEGALLEAVRGAKTRPVGEAWAWARRTAAADITTLYAATIAIWTISGRSVDYDLMSSFG